VGDVGDENFFVLVENGNPGGSEVNRNNIVVFLL